MRLGRPQVWLDRRSSSLVAFPDAADSSWAAALAQLVTGRRVRSLEVRKVNGEPVAAHPDVVAALTTAGFTEGYRGYTLR